MTRRQINVDRDIHAEGQRLDVWLFRTRLLKTRSLATKMILKGKIRVTRNGRTERVTKAHLQLKPGDRAAFMRGSEVIHVEMIGAAERRGPSSEASLLYRVLPLEWHGDKTAG